MSLSVQPTPISTQARQGRLELAAKFEKMLANDKNWYEFPTPQDYRDARRDGTNGFKKPVLNPKATSVEVVGRDGTQIGLRVIEPETLDGKGSKGVFLHFHAGGFVIGSNASYDTYLTRLANELDLTIASVDYRLAPEHVHPAGLNDCIDAALYVLSIAGQDTFGRAPLRVLGGESAGAWFAIQVALALRDQHNIDVQKQLSCICAGYGIFDLTYTPSCLSHKRNIVLSSDLMQRFVEAGFGHMSMTDRKVGTVSPLYADLGEGATEGRASLPPAQFLVGDIEPLLDDSIFMAERWVNAGNQAELHIVEGGCHAFTLIPMGDATEEGLTSLIGFVQKHL